MAVPNTPDSAKAGMSRRKFMGRTATAAAFSIVPSYVLAGAGETPPSEKLNIACVGVGGRGRANVNGCKSQNIVALCDVDAKRLADAAKDFPNAKTYQDFRVMLEKQGNEIDAVAISTPDHTHAIIAMTAMKMGKHVYVEKPLTHTISEARALAEAARKYKVATQMGNQGHASEGSRLTNEWIQAGAVGTVSEVHCWTNRPVWPQDVVPPKTGSDVPANFSWDLWLGPKADRPYSGVYCPFKWRGFWDFGCGALGDMGAHIIDHPFWALDLGHPESVEGTVSKRVNRDSQKYSYPMASIVTYRFPAKGERPPVTLYWYDGGLKPPTPPALEPHRKLGGNGVIYIGDKGVMQHGSHGGAPRLVPEAAMKAYERPPKTMPRSSGHYNEWFDACRGGKPAMSNFDYAGPLTEVLLLGCIASRVTDRRLYWDPAKMAFTNDDEANKYIAHQYRDGWSLT